MVNKTACSHVWLLTTYVSNDSNIIGLLMAILKVKLGTMCVQARESSKRSTLNKAKQWHVVLLV